MELCLWVCEGVLLSHTALGNLMSPPSSEERNRDSWLELHTPALPQTHDKQPEGRTGNGTMRVPL